MPDENANPNAPKDGKPLADDAAGRPPKNAPKDGKPLAARDAPPRAFAIGEPTGNLTRDSIIETVRGKLVAEGKSEDEAHELAVKRGFQMIKEG